MEEMIKNAFFLVCIKGMIVLIKFSLEELADHTDSLSYQQAVLQLHPPTPVVSLRHMTLPFCILLSLLHSFSHIHFIKPDSNLQ